MSAPIPVVYLVDSLKRGGVQKGTLLQVALLDRAKYAPQVWALRGKGADWELAEEFEKAGIPPVVTRVRSSRDAEGLMALARKLRDERVVLLNTKSYHPNVIGRIAGLMAGTPAIVVNYHNTYLHHWDRTQILLERMLRGCAASFVCVSETVRKTLQPLLGLPEERTRVLLNGTDLAAFSQGGPREETRARFGLPLDAPIVASIGRLAPVKDLATFLNAAPLVRRECPGALFIVVGDGEDRARLEALAAANGLSEMVRFLGSCQDIPSILRAVDCAALTSLQEGFPRIMLEAFTARTPFVSTPSGGVPELLEDGRNGLMVPFADPPALARAIVRTLRERGETDRRVETAYRDVQRFDIPSWVRELESIFAAALASRAADIEAFQRAPRPPDWLMRWRLWRLLAGLGLRKVFDRSVKIPDQDAPGSV